MLKYEKSLSTSKLVFGFRRQLVSHAMLINLCQFVINRLALLPQFRVYKVLSTRVHCRGRGSAKIIPYIVFFTFLLIYLWMAEKQ